MATNPDRFALDQAGISYDLCAADEFIESEHPRAENGQFGAGGRSSAKPSLKEKLSPSEKSTLSSYSGDDFLRINAAIRKGDTSDPSVHRLDAAIAKGALGGGTLYRGMTREAAKQFFPGGQIKAGDTVSDKAFLSTSSDAGEASARGLGGVVLKIETEPGAEGLDLSAISRNPNESEVLLPRNTKLKVIGVTPPKSPGQPVVVRMSYESKQRASDRLALDRATVRTIDQDGRLHIEISPISKANVCPYYGREIPNSEALGLEPNRVYQLLRDPVELAKAAPTFNNIPLLNQHIPVSAIEPQKESVVGATGSHATFTPPYLTNGLVIWDASAIAGIETGEQRELSSSYRYVADMTPGEFEGVPYDGRMTEIVGNHVALVPAGRAGADVVVGDSLPTEFNSMKKSNRAVAMRAAAGAYLRPILAQDGALPKLKAIVKGNKKPEFVAMDIKSVFKEADIDATKLTAVLQLACDEADEDKDDDKAEDEDETEEERKAREAKEKKAEDEDTDDKDKADDEDDDKDADKVDKKAMDAAIAAATTTARTSALNEFRAIREAEEAVRPLVGAVVAMDSAEAVYRFALDQAGVDNKGIHASALPALVKMATTQKSTPAPRVAMDAAASDDFRKRFPTATAIRRA